MDAVLLAATCDAKAGQRVLDAGCGPGAVMLCAAARLPSVTFVGLEREAEALALARENVAANDLRARMTVMQGDVADPFARLGLAPFDAVLANPPYFDDPSALRGPAPEKQAAWIAEAGLVAWIAFMVAAVREGGSITLIHRAERLSDILTLLPPRAGSFQVRPIHPFADAPAKRVIVRAIRTGKAPLVLLPALVLHERVGAKHTTAAEAIGRGAALEWG